MDARLDALLELTREPMPEDETFVTSVMTLTREEARRRDQRRRLLRRPAALAAAVVVIVAGAVAAVVRPGDVVGDLGPRSTEGRSSEPSESGRDLTAVEPDPSVPDVPAATEAGTTIRRGDLEWGYGSDASAFAVDHETGLRLDTRVSRTEIDTEVPQRITLTLTNTGRRPVTVSSPTGCALLVGSAPADAEGSEHAWRCASPTEGTGSASGPFVLQPGAHRVAETTLVLGAGRWSVVGMCRCTYETAAASSPGPRDDPLDVLPQLSGDLPQFSTPDQTTQESANNLVTPPIRVTAS